MIKLKNVIFDIGNVLVRWDPYQVIKSVLKCDPIKMYEQMRLVWIELNLGKITEQQAILLYQQQLNISEIQIKQLLNELKTSQTLIPGSLELLEDLHDIGIYLYSITDNTKEIIEYHRTHSNFLHYFKGIVSSSDIGVLKPDQRIYQYLLNKYSINPGESVFIDDLLANVNGAISVGLQAFQFIDSLQCRNKLIDLGIELYPL